MTSYAYPLLAHETGFPLISFQVSEVLQHELLYVPYNIFGNTIAGFSFEGVDTVLKRYFDLGLFKIALFFTETSHNLVETISFILEHPSYRETYGVSLSRRDHVSSPPPC